MFINQRFDKSSDKWSSLAFPIVGLVFQTNVVHDKAFQDTG